MWPSVMVGVVAHLLVFVVGWVASFLFAAEANVKKEWTLWGWWENRSGLRAEQMPSH
jgi:hypothetical protein